MAGIIENFVYCLVQAVLNTCKFFIYFSYQYEVGTLPQFYR